MLTRHFYPDDGDSRAYADAVVAALQFPGVASKATSAGEQYLVVPGNVAAFVEPLLDGIAGRYWERPADTRISLLDSLEEISEVRWIKPGISLESVAGAVKKTITLTDYQRQEAFAWRDTNVLMHHAPGAGKTLTSLLWALLSLGPIVVVTTARARQTWLREVRRCTTIEPLVIEGEEPYVTDHDFVPATSEKTGRELIACTCGRRQEEHVRRLPRLSIVSWEILPFHAAWLSKYKPVSLIMDESHRAKQRKRVAMVPVEDQKKPPRNAKRLADGRYVLFEPLQNVASATAQLARAAARRCATTATPVKNRRRDLWAQLDYLEPFAWGSYWPWAKRYCGAMPTGFNGSMVDTGKSNTPELQARLATLRSRVPLSVSHAALPKLRRDLFSIPVEEQNKSDITKKALKDAYARGEQAALELALMDACAKKRKAICAEVFEKVAGGGDVKITIFTGRRTDCDSYGDDLRKLLKDNPEVQLWCTHGGDDELTRMRYVDEYYAVRGPAVFVATGDSCGESVNGLHDTDIVYTAMLPWTPGDVIQREYRFVRQGSVRPVLMLYAVAEGTVDEHVVGKVIDKLPDTIMVGHEEMSTFRQTLRGGTSDELVAGLAAAILRGES